MEQVAADALAAKGALLEKRRSKQPLCAQIRQLSTKLQNETSKLEKLEKAAAAKAAELSQLQKDAAEAESKAAAQR
eukprot:2620488-Pyramimonas_sp.AAC.1